MTVKVYCHRMASSKGVLERVIEAAAIDGLVWTEVLNTGESTTEVTPDTGDIQLTVVNQDAGASAFVVGGLGALNPAAEPRWEIAGGRSMTFTAQGGFKVAFSST